MNNQSFFTALHALDPFLNPDGKKELNALDELLVLFPGRNLNQIVAEFKKYLKVRCKSPEGFCDRIRNFLNSAPDTDGSASETVESLTADFKTLTGPVVKALAKEYDLNLGSKNDFSAFEHWLRTGVKPPTAAELVEKELIALVQEAEAIRNENRDELSQDNVDRIVNMADRIKTKYKIDGLVLFMNKMGYNALPSKKTGPNLLKFLRQNLEDLAISRQKAAQIEQIGKF